ncbi:MAG: type II secretion system F family protein [Clostridiales bacterium]|jgi:type II secretory pathway component PulF|nr:type II secretion system F family protein [Clostridiales bacterium]
MIFSKNKLNDCEIFVFLKQFYLLFNFKISISESLRIISNQTHSKLLKKILEKVIKDIDFGNSFSQSLKKHNQIQDFLSSMIYVGEKSGNLKQIISKLISYYDSENKFKNNFKRSMIYPSIVCMMMIVVVVISVNFVIPSYMQLFNDISNLPLITQIVFNGVNLVQKFSLLILMIFILLLFAIKHFLNTFLGKYYLDCFLSKFNFFKLKSNFKFAQIMHITLGSHIDIISCINMSKRIINNNYLNKNFIDIIIKIKSGKSLSDSIIEDNFFSKNKFLISMIKIGETTGSLSQAMLDCENYFSYEIENTFQRFEKLLEPIITIILGLILAIIMLSIMLPTFNINELI